MEYLIQHAQICDTSSTWNGKTVHVHLLNGIIKHISPDLAAMQPSPHCQHIDARDCLLSVGWFDMRAHFQDPGYEWRESLQSGAAAAAAGGFTAVALLPNTHPTIQTKNEIAYIRQASKGSPVSLYPYAAVTEHTEGKALTEMLDLHHAGAIAFTDGTQPLWNPDILLKTLQYLQPISGLLIQRPEEKLLTRYAQMHEGVNSTLLGLHAMPALAEELMIARDLQILAYAGGRLHFSLLSTAVAVQMLREAKARGLQVTADVGIHHLCLTDAAVMDFDTNAKLAPPLRTEADRQALWQGLADGTIDAIVSDHTPLEIEAKQCEFDVAEFGAIGNETFAAVLQRANATLEQPLPWDKLIEKITLNPRRILRIPQPEIRTGAVANLTLFAPQHTWEVNAQNLHSQSHNSPYWGQELQGRVLGVWQGEQVYLRS